MTRALPSGSAGFTLIELLLAVFIFSMVMAGLAVIYSTAFRQGFRMIHETRLKSMGTLASRALKLELTAATRLTLPATTDPGWSQAHLQGLQNVAVDSAGNVITTNMSGIAAETRWFHFCVSDLAVAPCGDATHPVACLWYYSGAGANPPNIDATNCGQAAGGVTPQILATHIVSAVAGVGGSSADGFHYFTRNPSNGVTERNQVRTNFVMRQGATVNSPPLSFSLDTAYNMNFSQ